MRRINDITRFIFENSIKPVFHPNGYKEFQQRIIDNRHVKTGQIENSESEEELLAVMEFFDFCKYPIIGLGIAMGVYEYLIK